MLHINVNSQSLQKTKASEESFHEIKPTHSSVRHSAHPLTHPSTQPPPPAQAQRKSWARYAAWGKGMAVVGPAGEAAAEWRNEWTPTGRKECGGIFPYFFPPPTPPCDSFLPSSLSLFPWECDTTQTDRQTDKRPVDFTIPSSLLLLHAAAALLSLCLLPSSGSLLPL